MLNGRILNACIGNIYILMEILLLHFMPLLRTCLFEKIFIIIICASLLSIWIKSYSSSYLLYYIDNMNIIIHNKFTLLLFTQNKKWKLKKKKKHFVVNNLIIEGICMCICDNSTIVQGIEYILISKLLCKNSNV